MRKYSWHLSWSNSNSLTKWWYIPCSFLLFKISCTQNLWRLFLSVNNISCSVCTKQTRFLCHFFRYNGKICCSLFVAIVAKWQGQGQVHACFPLSGKHARKKVGFRSTFFSPARVPAYGNAHMERPLQRSMAATFLLAETRAETRVRKTGLSCSLQCPHGRWQSVLVID